MTHPMAQPAWLAPVNGVPATAGPISNGATTILSPDDLPDIDQCIAAVAERDGNLEDAARSLRIDRSTLLHLITQDPSAPTLLAQQLRLYTTLRTYEALSAAGRSLNSKMDEMSAFELSRTFTALSQSLADLTDKHESTQNVNITEVALRMLPPEARIALRELQQQDDSTPAPYQEVLPNG